MKRDLIFKFVRESPTVEGHTKQVNEKEPFMPLAEPFSPANSQAGPIESAISSLFSIFSPEPESYTENQQQLRKKRKKKKKRRYGKRAIKLFTSAQAKRSKAACRNSVN